MELTQTIFEVMEAVYSLKEQMGPSYADPVGKSDKNNKPQTRLEMAVAQTVNHIASHTPGLQAEVEGFHPVQGPGTPELKLWTDPTDGTSNDCRNRDAGARDIGAAASLVMAVAPARDDLRLSDFTIGAGMDLRNGQIWLAEVGKGAWTTSPKNSGKRQLLPVRNYHRHNPLIACEFYRHINWAARYLINQCVEWSDTASSFVNILRVPLGETDLFINNPLPELSAEGQRGHELGAIMPFLKEIQGAAVCTRKFTPLEEEPFTFDGMTPVMIGVDKATLDYYISMIRTNLSQEVTVGGRDYLRYNLIARLHETLPAQRWQKRDLT